MLCRAARKGYARVRAITARHRRDPPLRVRRMRKGCGMKLDLPVYIPQEVRLMMKAIGWVANRQHGAEVKLELNFVQEIRFVS